MNTEIQTISGTVDGITYHNEQNGYTVFDLDNGRDLITVVGEIPFISVGEILTLKGIYAIHPTYGEQFKAQAIERSMSITQTQLVRYLSSGAIKGVGPIVAGNIVNEFGNDTIDVIENEPLRLAKIRGISEKKALDISEQFKEQFGVRNIVIRLAEYGITPKEAMRIYKLLGSRSVEMVENNPYVLCGENIGIGFERADEIANAMPNSIEILYRVQAAVSYILRHNLSNGHTCLPTNALKTTTQKLCGCDETVFENALVSLSQSGQIEITKIEEKEFVFLKYMYSAERYCANRIALMLKVPPAEIAVHSSRLSQFEEKNGIIYDRLQREAIQNALTKGIMILTGGPGTGKTTTLNAIIQLLEESGAKIALAAPTGRAAKRMSELCGREAKTIHRLLEVEWDENDRQTFKRNEQNPLSSNVVVIDELSMMDVNLFDALLHAMSVNCRLIMVGDVDQLPSVGAGNVLHDLIDSEVVPVVKLDRVFRQAMQSRIVVSAHEIIAGKMPDLTVEKNSDFFMMKRQNPRECAELIGDLFCERLAKSYGLSPLKDIQVLCPSRKGLCGTVSLNNMIQSRINPDDGVKKSLTLKGFVMRVGDKVMQIHNNYDVEWISDTGESGQGVFNGDIGILESVDTRNTALRIRFDNKVATYLGDQIEDLELAYAVTVHKSQGSEFDCVILAMSGTPFPLCYRNLLYTAVTRAKKLLVTVGSVSEMQMMVDNNKRSKRYTAFSHFLREATGLL